MSRQSLFVAVQENLFGHVSFVQRGVSGMIFRECAWLPGVASGVTLADSSLDSDTFNKVLWGCTGRLAACEVESAAGEAGLRAAVDWFGERAFTVWAGAAAGKPAEAERLCATLGLQAVESEIAMSLPLSGGSGAGGYAASGVRIVPVRTESELESFVSVMAANWTPPDTDVARFYRMAAPFLLHENSPMRLFVGFAADEAVSCGELFLSEGGSVAGLHMICTRADFRRKGIGGAMTSALLDAGAGAALAVLLASTDGEPVYQRLGFAPCGLFTEYAVQPELVW